MSFDLWFLLALLGFTFALFVSARFRLDLVAMAALLALYLIGLVSVDEALAGFSHPLVIMIAGLFVVGGALFRTGVADSAGHWLERHAGHEPRSLAVAVLLVAALLSAFISSTGTVAVLIPVVIALAEARRVSPSKLLIPLAFGSLFGGMLTLIGTPPNLVVSAARVDAGLGAFGFFAYSLPGLAMLAVGVAYFWWFGHRLLPERGDTDPPAPLPGSAELAADYGLSKQLRRLLVPPGTALCGQSLSDSALRTRFEVTVLGIASPTAHGPQARRAESGSVFRAGDQLVVAGRDEAIDMLCSQCGLEPIDDHPLLPGSLRLVESVVPPRSRFVGKTLRELRLHSGAGVTAVAHQPIGGESIAPPDLDRRIEAGDAMLVTGRTPALQRLAENARDLVLLGGDLERHDRRASKAPIAIAIMLSMLVCMTLGWLPNVIAVLAAAVAMLFTRCLTVQDALGGINWESVILIAAILPMATALENTGGMTLAANALFVLAGTFGPHALLIAVFVLTSGVSQLVSNTATTVLAAPIALTASTAMGINPDPILMTVAIAASTAFLTPVASPVNTLVYNPGDYRFGDFARVGLPLQALLLATTLLIVPLLYPF